MQTPTKTNETAQEVTMEERLSKFGARIDELIEKAEHTKVEVKAKLEGLKEREKVVLKRSEEAFDEFKKSLDQAWVELNNAWHEVQEGAEKAAEKLNPKPENQKQLEDKQSEKKA